MCDALGWGTDSVTVGRLGMRLGTCRDGRIAVCNEQLSPST